MGGEDRRVAELTSCEAETLRKGIALVTANQEASASEFQIQPLFALAGRSRSHLWHFLDILGRRLFACPAWLANSKGLLLLHKMMRRSSVETEAWLADLLAARRGSPMLDLKALASSFRDKDGGVSPEHSAFVRAYAHYLAERVFCSQRVSLSGAARAGGAAGEAFWAGKPVEEILARARPRQALLRALLAVRPPARVTFGSAAVQEGLELILLDTFEVYSAINFALIELVERFGSMPGEQAIDALAVYRCAAKQAEGLAALYQQYGEMGVGKGVQFPSVAIMGESYLKSLEQYVAEAAPPPASGQPAGSRAGRRSFPQPPQQGRASPAQASLPSLLPDADLSMDDAVRAAADAQFATTAWALFFGDDDVGAPPEPPSPLPPPSHAGLPPASSTAQRPADTPLYSHAAAPPPPGFSDARGGPPSYGPATPSPPASPLSSYSYSRPQGQQAPSGHTIAAQPVPPGASLKPALAAPAPQQGYNMVPPPLPVPAQQADWYPPTPPPSLAQAHSRSVTGEGPSDSPLSPPLAHPGSGAPPVSLPRNDSRWAGGAAAQPHAPAVGTFLALPAPSQAPSKEDPATFGWELALDASMSGKPAHPVQLGRRREQEAPEARGRELAVAPAPGAAGTLVVSTPPGGAPQGAARAGAAHGFDQFLLDSMYEAAQAQRQIYSVAYRAHMQVKRDPFEASTKFEPPPFVQMAQRAQQQLAMYFEQRLLAQHAQYSSRVNDFQSSSALVNFHPVLPPPDLRCRNPDSVGVKYGMSVLVPYS